MAPTIDHARHLTALGLKAHWLAPPVHGHNATGKRPIESGWQQQAYRTDIGDPLRDGSNIGVQTGRVEGAPLQVIVVDLDSQHALEWAAKHLPETPMRTRTSHGEHWFYRCPPHDTKIPNKCRFTTQSGEKLEIDIRGDGGNVVVAPSVHPTGHVYSEIEPWSALRAEQIPYYEPQWLDGRKLTAASGRPRLAATADGNGESAANDGAGASPDSLDAFYAALPTEPPTDEERPGLLPEQFQTRLYNNCKRRLGGDGAIAALRAIALGQNYAPSGERNSTLFQAVRLLAEWFPDVQDAKLEEWVRGPLIITGDKPEQEELANFRDVLARSREKFAQRDHLLIRMAKASIVPTRALIETGLNLGRYLILGFPNGFHLSMQQDGRYGVAMRRRTELLPSIDHENILGWAARAGVARFEYVDLKGKTKKLDWDSIAKQHVWPINQARGSFALDISKVEGDTFYEAVAPKREDLKPLRSDAVDLWLQLLGGSSRGLLLDWLATFTDLARPTSALFLIGAAGAGKNLLADGLARYWLSAKPVPFEVTLRDFNEDLEKSPFIFADEKLPIDPRGRITLDTHLRALVTSTHQTLYRKHQKAMQVDGCVRIVAATNQHNFVFGDMDSESKRALAERILLIKPGREAAEYLRSLGGRPALESWVHGDALIRHVLWLAENRTVQPGSRLLVPGNGRGLINEAQNKDRNASDLCRWICEFLLEPKPPQGLAAAAVRTDQGELWVSSTLLSKLGDELWRRYVNHGRASMPPHDKITKALRSLSEGNSYQRSVPNGERWFKSGRTSYHTIELDQLFAFARDNDYDVDELNDRIRGSRTPNPGSTPDPAPIMVVPAQAANDAIAPVELQEGLESAKQMLAEGTQPMDLGSFAQYAEEPQNEQKPAKAPPKPRVKREPKAKQAKPREERLPGYYTPKDCPWAASIQTEPVSTEEQAVALWAPILSEAMAAMATHPSVYARTVAAYRAHRAAIRAGSSPVVSAGRALSSWYDGGLRPWFNEVSLVGRAA